MKIDLLKRGACVALLFGSVGLALPAGAQTRGAGPHAAGGVRHDASHGGHVWHGGGRGGWGWGWGLGFGVGWEAAYWGYPYAYYPYGGYYPYPYAYVPYPYAPYYEYSAPAPVPAVPPPPLNWYYCDSAGAYYPYVTQCPEAWRPVPSVPPDAAP